MVSTCRTEPGCSGAERLGFRFGLDVQNPAFRFGLQPRASGSGSGLGLGARGVRGVARACS
eukprot:3404086-Prymnesium_polylepis.2